MSFNIIVSLSRGRYDCDFQYVIFKLITVIEILNICCEITA